MRCYLFGFLSLLSLTLSAQNITRSPYSQYGPGMLQAGTFAQHAASGNAVQTLFDSADYSINNPASLSHVKFTIYNAGLRGQTSTFASGNKQQQALNASVAYLSLAFPIKKELGLVSSFGFQPYSAVGYRSVSTSTSPTGYPYQNIFEGSGGLNKFYVAGAINLAKNLHFGASASYLFGNSSKWTKVVFNPLDSLFDFREDVSQSVSGFGGDFGLQYFKILRDPQQRGYPFYAGAGLTYTTSVNVNTTSDIYARSVYTVNGYDYRRDTALYTIDHKGNMFIPEKLSFGLSYGRKAFWSLRADASYQRWSAYRENGVKSAALTDELVLSLGGSYLPDPITEDLKPYLKKIEYRAGLRYANTNLKFGSKQISDYSASVGFGLPIGKTMYVKKKFILKSYINVALEAGQMGTASNNLVKENYWRLQIGFCIRDIWFDRWKYD